MTPPTRSQPRRAVRDKPFSVIKPSRVGIPKQASKAGVRKATKKAEESQQTKKGGKQPKGGQAKLTRELESRISAMEPEVALLEQRELLGVAVEPAQGTPTNPKTPTPKSVLKAKRTRQRKRLAKEDKYMDNFLLSDEDVEGEGEGEQLWRQDRWIPDIEHRWRVTQKPKNVPHQIWMSYTLLDDYIYRQSLTDDEARSFPLIDDVFIFQNGGPQPAAPAGFQWDKNDRLVPL
ncbi:hypothetical protein F4677DRAFT_427792 [Hypoxylon crocopeplum]|nr:hypothetical protein F4677DRAFT_427792 [Hypoxylon crocopeplum]